MATAAHYVVTWRGAEIPIRVSPLAGRYLVRLGDQAVEVDLLAAGNGLYSLLMAGRSYEVDVTVGEEDVTVLVRNEPYRIQIRDARAARLGAAAGKGTAQSGKQTVTSPMPGKVVRHLVMVGDAVEAGQAVIVIEAMKMENELRTPGPGTVREIRASEGALVAAGAPLVIIE